LRNPDDEKFRNFTQGSPLGRVADFGRFCRRFCFVTFERVKLQHYGIAHFKATTLTNIGLVFGKFVASDTLSVAVETNFRKRVEKL